jgi:hypothetical protein
MAAYYLWCGLAQTIRKGYDSARNSYLSFCQLQWFHHTQAAGGFRSADPQPRAPPHTNTWQWQLGTSSAMPSSSFPASVMPGSFCPSERHARLLFPRERHAGLLFPREHHAGLLFPLDPAVAY